MNASNRSLNLLVTSLGGDLGQTLVKCLRLMTPPPKVAGCDMSPDSTGPAFVDDFVVIPPASDEAYRDTIEMLCARHDIEAVIPASEAEIRKLGSTEAPGVLSTGAAVVCQPYSAVTVYGDKFRCFQALQGVVELAPFADGADKEAVETLLSECAPPYVVKPRESSGSREIRVAANRDELLECLKEGDRLLVQQYIDDDFGEYSVGVFADPRFIEVIAFKRALGRVGTSWFADNHDPDPDVLRYARKIAEFCPMKGSYNIQVRKSRSGVRLLEINPRFSSLSAARAACGFKDVEWSVLSALGYSVAPPHSGYRTIRFRRFFHEMIDTGSGYAAVGEWSPRRISLKKGPRLR